MRKLNTRALKLATRSTSREINRQIILNLVREHQPISRAELARRMEVGRGILTAVVKELLDEGSIVERRSAETRRGRTPLMLRIRTSDRLVIAIDVRFSRTYVMLADFAGTELALESFQTLFSPQAMVGELARRVERIRRNFGELGELEGIGVAIPGVVDPRGMVLNAPQLGWRMLDIQKQLHSATELPVKVENASSVCALAALWFGRRPGDPLADLNFVYVNVSDGVGAGLVMNGHLIRGHNNAAGEVGHIPIDSSGPRCLCGSLGCWETFTSNLATLARYLGEEASPEVFRRLLEQQDLTIPELIGRARTGDARAREAIQETGRYLGIGLSILVSLLNPAQIIVGGEITGAWDLIHNQLSMAVAQRALIPGAAETRIIPEQINEHPRLRGAAALITAQVFAPPPVA
jgi:N-acetylglucosamine repressor